MDDKNLNMDFSETEFSDEFPIDDNLSYKGHFYYLEGKKIPHGWGLFRNPKGDILQGYFINGKLGHAAIKAEKLQRGFFRAYIGQIDDDYQPHGLGFEVCYNQYVTFGFYKHGTFYNDLSPLGQYIFDEFQNLNWSSSGSFFEKNYVVLWGGEYNDIFNGIFFYDNGDVLLGKIKKRNVVRPTGYGVKFSPFKDAIFGDFVKGELVKLYSCKDFFEKYCWNLLDNGTIYNKIRNYDIRFKDYRLYRIIYVCGNVRDSSLLKDFTYVKAVSINYIKWDKYTGEISVASDYIEHFYFDDDDQLCKSLAEKYDKHFLEIHLEDYTMTKGFPLNIINQNEEDWKEKLIHIHKKNFGWECQNIVKWDTLTIPQRLKHVEKGKYIELYTREFDLDNNHDEILKTIFDMEKDK